MKTTILILCAVLTTSGSFAQGTINFNNNIPGVLVTHIYRAPSLLPGPAGNGPNDTPPGTQDYSGMVLLAGPGYSAQLWAVPGANQTESSMQPALPITTFRTGAEAGFVVPVTVTLPGVPADAAVATVQLRVWDNMGGTINSWETAVLAGTPTGHSAPFNLFNIGGVGHPATILQGLQSFTISSIPEPSACALFGLGAAALVVSRRRS